MKFNKLIIIISTPVFLVSCSSIGPHKASVDVINYGDVIRQAQSEQLLRNIVHRTYGEPPSYIKITSITASYTLSSTIAASSGLSRQLNGTNDIVTSSLGFAPGVTFSDSPTISYVPVDDTSIVTLLEKPITYNQIALLMGNGTNFMNFMGKVGFLSVGQLENGMGAKLITKNTVPNFTQYKTFLHMMRGLITSDAVSASMIDVSGEMGIRIHFNKKSVNIPEAILVKKILQVPIHAEDFIFLPQSLDCIKNITSTTYVMESNVYSENDEIVTVRMRSISTIIDFLSHSVRIPESDTKANFVNQDMDSSAKRSDYYQALDDIMTIYSSNAEPSDVYVKTFMHNHWFYIKMSDANSKYTFDMLLKLMTLALGYAGTNTVQTAPVITIPTGGR